MMQRLAIWIVGMLEKKGAFQRNLYLWIRYYYLHLFKHLWAFSDWLDSRSST